MIELYSEDEVITRVTRLTRAQLVSFTEAQIVIPIQSENGPVFRRLDIVRIELLCDLSEQFELEVDALGAMISLVDQLHGVRAELKSVLEAIALEPEEVRNRIGGTMQKTRAIAT